MMTRRMRDWSDEVKVGTSADLTNDARRESATANYCLLVYYAAIVNSSCMIAEYWLVLLVFV
jgi:hypothetical protein